jgi:hypothetical protein
VKNQLLTLLVCTSVLGPVLVAPLDSWNDTAPKKAIIDFVERVTKEGSPDFVPMAERIAVFDNDGTLWAEQPAYFQALFNSTASKRCAGASRMESQGTVCFAA